MALKKLTAHFSKRHALYLLFVIIHISLFRVPGVFGHIIPITKLAQISLGILTRWAFIVYIII